MAEPSSDLENAERSTGLVAAFQSVTDGVLDLAKTHFELAKLEARQDVKSYVEDVAWAGAGLGFALLGGALLNVAVILGVGIFFGQIGMALAATALGVIESWIGLSLLANARKRLKARDGLAKTKDEIKRSTEWAKDIRETP